MNLLRETDLRATGESKHPFEERIQAREALHSFLHLAGLQASNPELLSKDVDAKTIQRVANAVERTMFHTSVSSDVMTDLATRMAAEPMENSMALRQGERFDNYPTLEELGFFPRGIPHHAVELGLSVPDLEGLATSGTMVDRLQPRFENRTRRRHVARVDWMPVPGVGENPATALGRISDGGFSVDVLTCGFDFRSMLRKWAKPWCYVGTIHGAEVFG